MVEPLETDDRLIRPSTWAYQSKRTWHPRDGRITELGMHATVDATLGYDVLIGITANAVG